MARAAQARQSVLWLDDLERFLGTGGLTAAQVGRLITGKDGHRVVVATLRTAEQARITADALTDDDAAVQALREARATTALLQEAASDRIEVFDYLVDAVQRRTPAGSHVPGPVVRAAIDTGDPADISSLGDTAYAQGRYALAEYVYRRDWEAKSTRPGLGAEHPDTLTSRGNLALVLHGLGRLAEAEAESRAVVEIRTRVLGAEHPATLTSRSNLAAILRDLGRLEEAEAE